MIKLFYKVYSFLFSIVILPFLFLLAFISRFREKKIDIGLGPEPLINNIYHKKALEKFGYSAETYVTSLYYITDDFDTVFVKKNTHQTNKYIQFLLGQLQLISACIHVLFRYRVLYFYFNGGVISFLPGFAWRVEPFVYKVAKIKTVVMPYGGDVQEMSRSKNLLFKHFLSVDYPLHRLKRILIEKKIDLWTAEADFILSGVEWVDYMYHWDMLMLGHFSIDVDEINSSKVIRKNKENDTFVVLHAPNHKAIKGSSYLEGAINKLNSEGFDIELRIIQKVSNQEILEAINNADLIADQFIVGWYAMFAIESMALGKPVLCYLRKDLLQFYQDALLLKAGEMPLINCSVGEIYSIIKDLYNNRDKLGDIGIKSRAYVVQHHSLEAIGKQFVQINSSIDLHTVDNGGAMMFQEKNKA